MALSEIEKLERRYAENPQGLTFAPLAEVHRKNGDVTRALELLRPGLELHPDYIPASIVLGRCHLDLNDLPAAETAFTRVLTLDGENVIALKALADISERLHRLDQAEQWLRSLLAFDRSNDEAQAQLERIELARSQVATAPEPPAGIALTAPAAAGSEPAEAESQPRVEPAIGADAEAAVARSDAEESSEAEPLALEDLEYGSLSAQVEEPPPDGLQVEEIEAAAEPVEPIAGLIGRDVDEAASGDEFLVETSEDIVLRSSGGQEFQMPDAAQELFSRAPVIEPFGFGVEQSRAEMPPEPDQAQVPEPEPEPEPIPEAIAELPQEQAPQAEAPVEPVEEPSPAWEAPVAEAPSVEPEPEPVPEPAAAQAPPPEIVAAAEPEMVVTETMAEVLHRQGHPVEALRVYRELEVRSSGDPRLLQRIAELEEESRPEPAEAPRKFTAADTSGQSVADFFQRMLAARPPSAPMPPAAVAPSPAPAQPDAGGAPTRPAADALTLSSVFGEEGSAVPPAVPAPGAPPAGVSFDEFFSPPGASTAARSARGSDAKNDDLDQFHAWLQNLKR